MKHTPRTRRPRRNCPRCGKNVAIHTTCRTAAIGETVVHKCPHGVPCEGVYGDGSGPCMGATMCDLCNKAMQ